MRLTCNSWAKGKPVTPTVELLTCQRLKVNGWRLPDLRAPYWRLYRNHDNHAVIVRPEGELTLRRDRFYLIAPETGGHGRQHAVFDHLYIHFLAGTPYDHCRDFIIEFPEDRHTRHAMAVITHEQYHPQLTPEAVMAGLSLCTAALATLPRDSISAPPLDLQLQPVMERVKQQPELHYSNEFLAEQAGMSVNTFLRHFRAAYGIPPQQYLIEERLRRACVLLQYSALSMEEIAEQTGFCDRFYFTRMFTRYRQISPAEFRKLNYSQNSGSKK